MTDDIAAIAGMLKRLQDSQSSEEAKRTTAMTSALQSISAALTEFVAIAESKAEEKEGEDEGAEYGPIVDAIRSIEFPKPSITVAAPTVNVPAVPVSLTVQAGPNSITVPEPTVTVVQSEWEDKEVIFEYRDDMLVSAIIRRL